MCQQLENRIGKGYSLRSGPLAVNCQGFAQKVQIPPTPEAVKKLLDQNITPVTEIHRLGRGQSIGSRCHKFQRAPASSFRGFVLESTVQLHVSDEIDIAIDVEAIPENS